VENSQYRTAGNIISYTTVINIAYLASPDLSGTLGIIIYFLRRKYGYKKLWRGISQDTVRSHSLIHGHWG